MINLAASNSEDAFYSQLLVAVVLAAGFGIYTLIKSHKARYGSKGSNVFGRLKDIASPFGHSAKSYAKRSAAVVQELVVFARRRLFDRATHITQSSPEQSSVETEHIPLHVIPAESPSKRGAESSFREDIPIPVEQTIQPVPKKHDLTCGMELLDRNFLVQSVERTDSDDRRDISIRCLCFNELVRRNELSAVAGAALTVYTVDENGFYGKTIRCEAMKELASRTVSSANPENPVELQKLQKLQEIHAN